MGNLLGAQSTAKRQESGYERERYNPRSKQDVGGTRGDQGLNPEQQMRFSLDEWDTGRSRRVYNQTGAKKRPTRYANMISTTGSK